MPFAPKETTTGGKALKFYASLRLDVRKVGSLKKNDGHIGNRVRVKVAKNKVAPPFKQVEVDLLFNEGISKELDLLDASLQSNIITKSGSWFSFEGAKIAQGREQALRYLKDNVDIAEKINTMVHKALSEHKA